MNPSGKRPVLEAVHHPVPPEDTVFQGMRLLCSQNEIVLFSSQGCVSVERVMSSESHYFRHGLFSGEKGAA